MTPAVSKAAEEIQGMLTRFEQLEDAGEAAPNLEDLSYQQLKEYLLERKAGVNRGAVIQILETQKRGVDLVLREGGWSAYKLKSKAALQAVLDAYPPLQNIFSLPPEGEDLAAPILVIFSGRALAGVYMVKTEEAYFRGPDNQLPGEEVIEWAKKHAKALNMEWLNASSIHDPDHVKAGIKVLHKTGSIHAPSWSLGRTDLHAVNPFLSELQYRKPQSFVHYGEEDDAEEYDDSADEDDDAFYNDEENHVIVTKVKPEFLQQWKERQLEIIVQKVFPGIRQISTLPINHPSIAAYRSFYEPTVNGTQKAKFRKCKHGSDLAINELCDVWYLHVLNMGSDESWKDFPSMAKDDFLKMIQHIEKTSMQMASANSRRDLHMLKRAVQER
jgi:hypothetical protein